MDRARLAFVWLAALIGGVAISLWIHRSLGLVELKSLEEALMRIIAWPTVIWLAALMASLTIQGARAEALQRRQAEEMKAAARHEAAAAAAQKEAAERQRFAVQLVGAQLTTTLFDRTKPLAYYLNPILDQLKPLGPRPVPVFAPAVTYLEWEQREPTMERRLVLYANQLSNKLVWPFRYPFHYKEFIYKPLGKLWDWRTKPIEQFITLPIAFEIKEPERLAAIERGERDPALPSGIPIEEERLLRPPLWRWHWRHIGDLDTYLWYPRKPPFTEFHYRFGHAGAYDSLAAAFAHIEAQAEGKHPVVWSMAVDAPEFPRAETDRNRNDSGTLFMLAHPQADTGRRPLVWLQRPVTLATPGRTLTTRAVAQALQQAFDQAGLGADAFGHLVVDFGRDEAASRKLGRLAEALASLPGDPDTRSSLIAERTDLVASLGELGADTAQFSALVAAWAAHAKNKPALLVGMPGGERVDVLVFRPPQNHVPPPAGKAYYGAVAEPEFSRPWWGERLDGKPDFGDEPNKERADGNGLVKPAKPFVFRFE